MAQTNQEVSIKLTVESAEFKKKMLEARKALHLLEGAGVQAAGGQKKYSAAIKQARLALTQANGAYKAATTSLQLHEIQARKTANATTKLGKTQKKSNMAMTQAAYAIDDMQYGFQGVQNNIQAIAVSMGASGPLVVGLTLVTVAVGLLAKKYEKMGREAREAAKLASKAFADAQGPIVKLNMFADAVKTSETNTYQFKKAMIELKKMGFDPVNGAIDDFVTKKTAMIKLGAIESATVQSVSKKIAEQLTLQNKINQAIKKNPALRVKGGKAESTMSGAASGYEIGQIQDKVDRIAELEVQIADISKTGRDTAAKLIADAGLTALDVKTPKGGKEEGEKAAAAYFEGYENWMLNKSDMSARGYKDMNKSIKESLELQRAQGASKKELLESELAQLQAVDQRFLVLTEEEAILHRVKVLQAEIASIPGLADNMIGVDNATIAMEKFKQQLADIKLMLDEGIISWDEYIKRIDNTTESYNKVAGAQQNTIDVGGMLQGQLTGLISGFAEAAGSGDNMGNALLKGLGNMLMQLGGLIITAGFAAESLVITLSNPAMAPLAIAAGAALVAAGAAVSSFGNKAGGGGGSSSAGRVSSNSSSTVINNPVRENARVRNSNLIIPMDMMRYGMQNANDNYSGFN